MKNYFALLRYETRKLLRSKLLYIVFAAVLFFPIFYLLMNKFLMARSNPEAVTGIQGDSTLIAFGNLTITPVLALLIGFFFTEDYKTGAIKNILGRGYAKSEFYWAKVTCLFAMSVLFLLLADLGIYAVASSIEGRWRFTEETLEANLWNFAGSIALISTFLGLASLFRRPVGAMLSALLLPGAFSAFLFLTIDLPLVALLYAPQTLSSFFTPYFYGYQTMMDLPCTYAREIGLPIFLVLPILIGYFANRKRDVK